MVKRGIRKRAQLMTRLKSAELTVAKLEAEIIELNRNAEIQRGEIAKVQEYRRSEQKEAEVKLAEARRRTISDQTGASDYNFLPLYITKINRINDPGGPFSLSFKRVEITVIADQITVHSRLEKPDPKKAALETIGRIAAEASKS